MILLEHGYLRVLCCRCNGDNHGPMKWPFRHFRKRALGALVKAIMRSLERRGWRIALAGGSAIVTICPPCVVTERKPGPKKNGGKR